MRDIPKHLKNLYKKAMSGKSRKSAVRMFCLECVGYQANEVILCTDEGCPLFLYRLDLQTEHPDNVLRKHNQPAESTILFDPVSKVAKVE